MEDKRKKVSSEEISQLYQFTRKHYVEFYDVQTELVDHLANAIEEQWEGNPEMAFEASLHREFKKFGVFGFSGIMEKRQAAMQKKYLKLIWRETKMLLKQPKVVFPTMFLFLVCKVLLVSEAGYTILSGGIIFLCFMQLFYVLRLERKFKKKKKSSDKIYLLEEMILKAGGYSTLFLFPFYLVNFFSSAELLGNLYIQLLIAFLVSTIVLISYICLYELPKKKEEILEKVYPELKFLE